jgi:hypothetical protein
MEGETVSFVENMDSNEDLFRNPSRINRLQSIVKCFDLQRCAFTSCKGVQCWIFHISDSHLHCLGHYWIIGNYHFIII